MSKRTKPASVAAVCEECQGHGYEAGGWRNERTAESDMKIQRCLCETLKDDGAARSRFVEELERHEEHALLQLADILSKPALSIVLRTILDDEEAGNR